MFRKFSGLLSIEIFFFLIFMSIFSTQFEQSDVSLTPNKNFVNSLENISIEIVILIAQICTNCVPTNDVKKMTTI